MRTSNKLSETDQTLMPDGDIPLDPFAVDIFGVKSAPVENVLPEETQQIKPPIKRYPKSDWAKILPRMTREEVEFSYKLRDFPAGLTEIAFERVIESIARYTFRQKENIDLGVISVAETNLKEAADKTTKSPKVFFTIASQPTEAIGLIAINNDFATSIIDLILGGKGSLGAYSRNLSPIEKTILQFLMLNILQEINSFLGSPIFVLQSVTHELKQTFTLAERGAEIVVNMDLEELNGIITLIAPQKFLQNLEGLQNPLLNKKTEKKKIKYFEKYIPDFDLRLQIGTTSLDTASLLFLEPNDIVLLDKTEVSWQEDSFYGKLKICAGQGKNVCLKGITEDGINFKIEEIASEETRRKFTPIKFKMDENEINEEAEIYSAEPSDPEISAAMENVQVALRVEISGNKISLRDLQKLQSGQIIALGCRPTDPVRLVTDNNDEPIATGELIDIEGQLGVRLTKVFI